MGGWDSNPKPEPGMPWMAASSSLMLFEVARLQSRIGQRPLITVAWGIAPGIVSN